MKVVHYPGLGDLTYQANAHFDSAEWSGTVMTPSGETSVTLNVEPAQDEFPSSHAAVALEAVKREPELRHKIAEALEELANDWQDDDDEEGEALSPLTADMMVERMTMSGFSVEPNGQLVMYYDDGDLFFGHAMMGVFDWEFNLLSTDIPG